MTLAQAARRPAEAGGESLESLGVVRGCQAGRGALGRNTKLLVWVAKTWQNM